MCRVWSYFVESRNKPRETCRYPLGEGGVPFSHSRVGIVHSALLLPWHMEDRQVGVLLLWCSLGFCEFPGDDGTNNTVDGECPTVGKASTTDILQWG